MGSENCGCVVKPRSENCPATWDPAKPLSVWRCTRGDPWLTRWPLILVLMGWLRASQATGHVTIALEWFFGPRKNFKFFLQIWSSWGHTAVKSNALAELMNWAIKIHFLGDSREIGPRWIGPRTFGPRTAGPRTVGPGAQLSGAQLSGAQLSGAQFTGARFA